MEMKFLHQTKLNTRLKVLDPKTTEFLRCERPSPSTIRDFYLLCHLSSPYSHCLKGSISAIFAYRFTISFLLLLWRVIKMPGNWQRSVCLVWAAAEPHLAPKWFAVILLTFPRPRTVGLVVPARVHWKRHWKDIQIHLTVFGRKWPAHCWEQDLLPNTI